MNRLLKYILQIGYDANNNKSVEIRRHVLLLVSVIIGIAALVWGLIYIYLDLYLSASIPLSYSVITLINLIYFQKSKNIVQLQFMQLVLVLLLPFLLMWSLGGFASSSFVFIWAFFTPLASIMYANEKEALRWFSLFILLVIISVLINPYLIEHTSNHMPLLYIDLFFLLNILAGFMGIYFIIKHILTLKESHSLRLLNVEHEALLSKTKELEYLEKNLDKKISSKIDKMENINNELEIKIALEVKKSQEIQKSLSKAEKLAAMGEMIGNIAHQWRQPLTVITTSATGILFNKELDTLSDTQLLESCEEINSNAQYLSETIDDFKNFIKGDRIQIIYNVSKTINRFINLVTSSIKNHNINMQLDLDDTLDINGYPNELIQCLMIIFNNAKDILDEKELQNKHILIKTSQNDNNLVIKIQNNGGNIPAEILPRIFEPYFTTKHKSQGTGIGLHMCYNLIVDGMQGTIEANNINYEYQGVMYSGVEFIIVLSTNADLAE